MKEIFGIINKEILSEFRTKSSLATVGLFIVTTITIIGIGIGNEQINAQISGGLLWVVMFFSSMVGLSKIFIQEEERGTSMFLLIQANSSYIYFGKLIYNTILSIVINIITILLFLFFINQVRINSWDVFILAMLLSSIGLAAATTIISALISKAGSKNALFPVLAFPVLLPLVFIGISLTIDSIEGISLAKASNYLNMLVAYSGINVILSYFLFDYIWQE
ncbi:MAG: heme exporter protein CcmB [Ignavibacteria bacterium]|nr:heme exporter protein CcmB [Ignavibacteria bacterium]